MDGLNGRHPYARNKLIRQGNELIWNDRCVRWFGTDPPTDQIVGIKVDVEDAEYWEENLSLGHKLAGLFSSLTGGEPNQMDVRHDKVDWTEAVNSSDTPS